MRPNLITQSKQHFFARASFTRQKSDVAAISWVVYIDELNVRIGRLQDVAGQLGHQRTSDSIGHVVRNREKVRRVEIVRQIDPDILIAA